MRTVQRLIYFLIFFLLVGLLVSCSTTSAIADGEQLFTGLTKIQFSADSACSHAEQTKEELEYVLASAPNGALFGSSYYRSPINPKLWIWNAFSQKEGKFAQWMTRTFASQPKLLSQVNPRLRASVAESQLKKYGYFDAHVDYDIIEQHNPKKAKIAYRVDMGHLWTLDSIRREPFGGHADSLLLSHERKTQLHKGDGFSVMNLEGERQRIASLLRNNGFYYYQKSDVSYLADTINSPGCVNLRLQLVDSLGEKSLRQWAVGRVRVNMKRSFMEQFNDSLTRRSTTICFSGRKPQIRPGVVLRALKLRPGQLYSAANEEESMRNLQAMGLFNYTSLHFDERKGTSDLQEVDTLDLTLDCVFDKPYDFYVEANAKGKTTGRLGPELVVGFTKRNALHGGEKLDINLHGSYEWDGHTVGGSRNSVDTYEVGGDVSLELPRLLLPWQVRRRFVVPPSTLLKASANIINRAGYFRMHTAGGELTYRFQPSVHSRHEVSPLIVDYQFMNSTTERYRELAKTNLYTLVMMSDQFLPKMRYTYTYSTAATSRNPFSWEISLTESGNVLSLGYLVAGRKWSEADKQLFKNPYSQFFKVSSDLTKTWRTGSHSSLVGHLAAGAIWSYANSTSAPYSEKFWAGGANSIRAFGVRTIGPGRYRPENREMSYLLQVGDMRFLANLEYRFRLAGALQGAAFLDAGNVWNLKSYGVDDDSFRFKPKEFFNDLALGTGIGLRYDLDYFVVRLDWGIGLHLPYDTGRSGYYNIRNFGSGQTIHLAIGYPF